MITIEHHRDAFLILRVSGKLTKADYEAAIPELELAMSRIRGKPRVLILLEDFQGWDMAAIWEDLRFDMKHYDDFGRIAVVGESTLEKWGTYFAKPFTGAELRYFDRGRRAEAEAWLGQPA